MWWIVGSSAAHLSAAAQQDTWSASWPADANVIHCRAHMLRAHLQGLKTVVFC